MRIVHDAVLTLHAVCGMVALVSFWAAALTVKGGPAHRRAGRVYVAVMLAVVVTALALAVLLYADPRAVRDFTGVPAKEVAALEARLRGVSVFFVALALLTVTAGWNGLRILRIKQGAIPTRSAFTMVLHGLNLAFAPVLFGLGARDGEPLLLIFGVFCVLTGAGGLWTLRHPAVGTRRWLHQHLSNMIATGIAAHTAFLAVGAVRWFPNLYSYSPTLYVIPWVIPAVTGSVAIVALKRRYRQKEGEIMIGLILTVGLLLTGDGAQARHDAERNFHSPGPEHRHLDVLSGDWAVRLGFPAGPNGMAEGTASCEARWVMDGRFLRLEYSSVYAGKPLTVVRYLGFDRHRQKVVEVQFESTRTDVLHSEGEISRDGRTITSQGRHADSTTGQQIPVRIRTTIPDDNEFTATIIYGEGREAKTITLSHRRR